MRVFLASCVVLAAASGHAGAAWGLKYEVSPNGVSWGPSIGAVPGASVYFRMSAYFDPGTQVSSAGGVGNAMVFGRCTGQQKITGRVPGDAVTNLVSLTQVTGVQFLALGTGASEYLIGTNVATSFGGNVITDLAPYLGSPQTSVPILQGKYTLGSDSTPRTLVFKNSLFGNGTSPGLRFYSDAVLSPPELATPLDNPNHTDFNATIELKNSGCVTPTINAVNGGGNVAPSQSAVFSVDATDGAFYEWLKNGVLLTESSRISGVGSSTLTVHDPYPTDAGSYRARIYGNCGATQLSSPVSLTIVCGGDLNRDGFVEDADFVIFVGAYDQLQCPAGPCPADLNVDGFVDDLDFVVFVTQYNELICP
ncbi:MAG: hypothetical protein KF691_01010 [Phycisphaeraceae bacterium]|nr:hypothetical protein [Phycisphaeraceae bacterium]